MSQQTAGFFQPFFNTAQTGTTFSRSMTAGTHWIGGQFFAPVTDTVTEVHFRTATCTSPVGVLEAAIVALDASGYPLGSDIAVSSTTATNPASNTNFALTISASVTAGNLYGVIVRFNSYTSGTFALQHTAVFDALGGITNSSTVPWASYNIGSNTGVNGHCMVGLKYSSAGWQYSVGLFGQAANAASFATGATAGNCVGNKFTLNHHATLSGYMAWIDADDDCTMGLYSGTDNTVMTGTSVAVVDAARRQTGPGGFYTMLGTPVAIPPGTYRVAVKASAAVTIAGRQFPNQWEAGAQEVWFPGGGSWMSTAYAAGAWTDTTTGICVMSPIFSKFDDGRPQPQFVLGL